SMEGRFQRAALIAAISRAMPACDCKSERLAPTSMTRRESPTGMTSRNGVPGVASTRSSRMPSWSSPSNSSRAEQSMPFETMPRRLAAIRTMRSSRDLLEETNVRVVKDPNVGNVVALHGYATGPHAERPTGVALGVDSRGFEHGRMHHAGTENLRPSCSLAHG